MNSKTERYPHVTLIMHSKHTAILSLLPWDSETWKCPAMRYDFCSGFCYENPWDLNDHTGMYIYDRRDFGGQCNIRCGGCQNSCRFHINGWQPHRPNSELIHMCLICAHRMTKVYQEIMRGNPNATVYELTILVSRLALMRSIVAGSTPVRATLLYCNDSRVCNWCLVYRESHKICEHSLRKALSISGQKNEVLIKELPLLADVTYIISIFFGKLSQIDNMHKLKSGQSLTLLNDSREITPFVDLRLNLHFSSEYAFVMNWVAEQPLFIKQCKEGYDLWYRSHNDDSDEYIATIVFSNTWDTSLCLMIHGAHRDYGIDLPIIDKRSYLAYEDLHIVCDGICFMCGNETDEISIPDIYAEYRVCARCDKDRRRFGLATTAACYWFLAGSLCGLPPDLVSLIAHKVDLIGLG